MGNYTLRLTKDEFEVLKLIDAPKVWWKGEPQLDPLYGLMSKIHLAIEEEPNEQVEKLYSIRFDEISNPASEFYDPRAFTIVANFHMMQLTLNESIPLAMLLSSRVDVVEFSKRGMKRRIKNMLYDMADSIKEDGEDQGCISDEFVPYSPRRR